jgi:hypothetical protein
MTFTDTGRTSRSAQKYKIEAVDPLGNISRSDWVTVTIR